MDNVVGFLLFALLIWGTLNYVIEEVFVYPKTKELSEEKTPEFRGSLKEFIKWLFSKRGGY